MNGVPSKLSDWYQSRLMYESTFDAVSPRCALPREIRVAFRWTLLSQAARFADGAAIASKKLWT
jgi:hypothetical protein